MSEVKIEATETGYSVTKELMDSIAIREYNSGVKFEAGVEYDVQMLTSTRKSDGVDYPLFKLGEDITIPLNNLAQLYVSDESVQLANIGEEGECLPFSTQLQRFKSVIEANGEVPKKIKCVSRIKQGATSRYFEGQYADSRKNAYKLKKMEHLLDKTDFPLLVLRGGRADTEADNWNTVERITLQKV